MTTFSAAAILGTLCLALQTSQANSALQDDLEWVGQHAGAELDRLMPTGTPEVWNGVLFRSERDVHFQVKERFFMIDYDYTSMPPKLKGVVVRPVNKSIRRQLLDVHAANRAASIEQVRVKLKVDRGVVREGSCPILKRRVRALEGLRVVMPRQGIFAVHPEAFEISAVFNGERTSARLFDERQPLVRWAIQTYEMLWQCAKQGAAASGEQDPG